MSNVHATMFGIEMQDARTTTTTTTECISAAAAATESNGVGV